MLTTKKYTNASQNVNRPSITALEYIKERVSLTMITVGDKTKRCSQSKPGPELVLIFQPSCSLIPSDFSRVTSFTKTNHQPLSAVGFGSSGVIFEAETKVTTDRIRAAAFQTLKTLEQVQVCRIQ